MKTHVNVVGWIDVITGALFTALAAVVSLGVLLFAPMFNGAPPWKPEDAVYVFAVALLLGAVFLVIGIPALIAGIALLRRKGWARTLAIVVAILALASFPLGTGAGIYTLWVLTQKETEQLLGAAA